jgi:P4 family phage/plasmid primase-like protien
MMTDKKVGPRGTTPGGTDNTDHHQIADTSQYNGGGRQPAITPQPWNTRSAEDFQAEIEAILAKNAERKAIYEPPKDWDEVGQDCAPDDLADSPPDDVGPPRLEDALIGERVAAQHLQKFIHTNGLGWLKFDGRRWKPVEEIIVAEVVRKALIDLHRSEAESGAEASRLQQISRMLSASRIRAITYVTKLCKTTEEAFDAHPHLLNVRNAVVNLRDGTLRLHDPALLLTKVTMVNYVPGTTHRDWQRALTALPADAVDWLQIRMGQGLTGYPPPDDVLVVAKGSGANGKTTVFDGVREAAGPDYAVTLPERVLLARTRDHPTEMMGLRGARLGLMEEFPELGHLNVKRLKDLHGVGEMTARYCGKDSVTWKPSHTVFVTTNYLPRVDESDHGTWRRLALVDFPYRYRKAHEEIQTDFDKVGDPNLRERLRRGGEGQHQAVLAWLIEGAVKWYRNGQVMPQAPASVREATAAWRGTSDLLLRYMDENLVFDGEAHVMSTELFEDFTQWLKANGHVAWSDQSFSARLGQHPEAIANGVEKKRGIRSSRPGLSRCRRRVLGATAVALSDTTFTAWLGIRFRTHDDEEKTSDDLQE